MQAPARRMLPWAVLLLLLVGVVVTPVPGSVAAPGVVQTKSATDGQVNLQNDDLASAPSVPYLSGLRDNTISATYSPSSGSLTTGTLYYTLDGSVPTATSSSVTMTRSGNTFTAVLTVATLEAATTNALVRFVIEACDSTGCTLDDNAGAAYRYRLDKSVPTIISVEPSAPQGSAFTIPVVSDQKPPIFGQATDEAAETNLLEPRLLIDGTDFSAALDTTALDGTGHHIEFNVNYARLPTNFAFTEGEHLVEMVRDQVFHVPAQTLRFAVDRTPPLIQDLQSQPEFGVSLGSITITGRGVNVSVSARVDDAFLALSSDDVTVELHNVTNGLVIGPQPLEFNTAASRWRGEIQIPHDLTAQPYRFQTIVRARDAAGNDAELSTPENIQIDPTRPVVVLSPTPSFVKEEAVRVTASVSDPDSGINATTVQLRYLAVVGAFTGSTAPRDASGTHVASMSLDGSGNFTATIPRARDGTVVNYLVTVRDAAGNTGASTVINYTVDVSGPVMADDPYKPFRSRNPHEFLIRVTDLGAGVNISSLRFFYRVQGESTYQERPLASSGAPDLYLAVVNQDFAEGTVIQYYATSQDVLGNAASMGSEANPATTTIDKTKPSMSIAAPETTGGPTFTLSWSGSDDRAGVATYTIQARSTASGADAPWVVVLSATASTSMEVCVRGAQTFEFRGFATDGAGNSGDLPPAAMASTQVTGAGCVEQLVVSVFTPAIGAVVDAAEGAGSISVTWNAASSRTITPGEALRITFEFSPDAGRAFYPLVENAENTGSAQVPARVPSCTQCQMKVVATSLSGARTDSTSGFFSVVNGDPDADLDANQVADEWEIAYFGGLGKNDPAVDLDGDGLDNAQESRLGTDPFNPDTDGDAASDHAESVFGTDANDPQSVPSDKQLRSLEYTHWYWVVPGLAGGSLIVFFIGLTRRW